MNIAFFQTRSGDKQFFRKNLAPHQLIFHSQKLDVDSATLAEEADIISVFVGSAVNESVLKQLPSVKAVVTRSTGTDHIDTKYCAEHNIQVFSVPQYGSNTVAEHTFALMLALSRRLVLSIQQTSRGDFSNDELTGFDLFNKTLGIIGLGNIGTRVAEIGNAFGMNVISFTRTPKSIPHVEFVSLEQLLAQSDIITFHTPLTPQTHHLVNEQNVSLIKRGAILINTARGGLIQTRALVKALQEKTVAGAGLDVLEEEDKIKEEKDLLAHEEVDLELVKTLLLDHVLRDFENVIITPHNAFNSHEAIEEINRISLNNIVEFMKKNREAQLK